MANLKYKEEVFMCSLSPIRIIIYSVIATASILLPKAQPIIMKVFTITAISSLLTLTAALSPPYEPICETCVYTPNENKCDITTSCTYVWGHDNPHTPGPYYCACRHGYRTSRSIQRNLQLFSICYRHVTLTHLNRRDRV